MFLQSKFNFITVIPLKGDIHSVNKKPLNWHSWISGEWQLNEEKYLNDSFGFRPDFIRLNNQISYSFFNLAKARGVVVGKQDYLFEKQYIDAWSGKDFLGKDSIARVMAKVKYIQDTLKKLNKDVILIFAPGKASFFPEFIPDAFHKVRKETNHEYFVKYANTYGLHIIDLWTWFNKHKSSSKYPLYSKYGIHWSSYGNTIFLDTLTKYIKEMRHINMPSIIWDGVEESYECRESDCDLSDGINLLAPLPPIKLAYPKIHCSDNFKMKPCVLAISDSHYWGVITTGMAHSVFDQPHFMYYYKENVLPGGASIPINQVNIKAEIENHDVILIMATDATLSNFGWGFIQDAYKIYGGK